MTDRLMLLDSASLYFRAFYGVPDKVKAPDGSSVNAVRGLLDIIAKLVTLYRPAQLVACWDDDWRPQWRVERIPSYKSHRLLSSGAGDVEDVPEALVQQVPLIRRALGVIGIPIIGVADHEADDVIGTLSARSDIPVDIVTGDRDLFQLVDDARDVRVVYTARGMSNLEVVTDDVVVAKYGILPSQYADFATLRGDTSDGLPGVKGVGEKSAAALLQAHGDLQGIREAAASGVLSAAVSARFAAASDYLDVAPAVVRVVRDLPVEAPGMRLGVVSADEADAADRLAEQWNLGGSMTRVLQALASVA